MTGRGRVATTVLLVGTALVLPLLAAALAEGAPTPTSHEEAGRSTPGDPTRTSGDLAGLWSAPFPQQELFHLRIRVSRAADGALRAAVRTPGAAEEELPAWGDRPRVRFQPVGIPVAFDGRIREGTVDGFLHHGSRALHLVLEPAGADAWEAEVDLLHFDEPGARFYVAIDPAEGRQAAALFLGSSRAPSLFGDGFEGDAGGFRFRDLRTGAAFRGRLAAPDSLILETTLMGTPVTLALAREKAIGSTPPDTGAYRYAPPPPRDDGLSVGDAAAAGLDVDRLERLVREVRSGDLPETHAVLLSVGGRLLFEEHFHGFDRSTLHDLRSASKSVAAPLVGAAIEEGLLPGVHAVALSRFPRLVRLESWDPRKGRITVEDLLTMSSGLDLVDARGSSAGAEWRYQLSDEDWIGFAWDVPMIADPGTEARYGSGNPMLVGGVLDRVTRGRAGWFAHDRLFGPLGVDRYAWQLDPAGIPYMGGGMYLRPRDQLKLGLLHLNGGRWRGRRILPEAWVDATLARHAVLRDQPQRNAYGYLWWHHAYRVGDREIASVEARGAGGQYVFVVPELQVVAVVNSGNYRNRDLLRQPEAILEEYLLPAVVAVGER